jgi:hypothetical protein
LGFEFNLQSTVGDEPMSAPKSPWSPLRKNDPARPVPYSLANFDALPDSAYVRVSTLAGLLDVSEATVWRKVRLKALPAPSKLVGGSMWQVGVVRALMRSSPRPEIKRVKTGRVELYDAELERDISREVAEVAAKERGDE